LWFFKITRCPFIRAASSELWLGAKKRGGEASVGLDGVARSMVGPIRAPAGRLAGPGACLGASVVCTSGNGGLDGSLVRGGTRRWGAATWLRRSGVGPATRR